MFHAVIAPLREVTPPERPAQIAQRTRKQVTRIPSPVWQTCTVIRTHDHTHTHGRFLRLDKDTSRTSLDKQRNFHYVSTRCINHGEGESPSHTKRTMLRKREQLQLPT
ncbi:unnamed protein product, partial [Ectocarpus fasciculatus]